MRLLALLILSLTLVTGCSTMSPASWPSAAVAQPSGVDVAGRWSGRWTGTGLFQSYRRDEVTLELVQHGDRAQGHLVLQGTGAAESVPWPIRLDGQLGTRVVAHIAPGAVTLRHALDGRRFVMDLALSEDGQRMTGVVRDSYPLVGLVLTREPGPKAAEMPAPQAKPEPAPEPQPQMAMVPPAPEPKEAEAAPQRPKHDEFVAVQELPAVHFDFDKAELRPEAVDTLSGHATWLELNRDTAVVIEGHCDERGTAEYNVALGERRANAVRDYLARHGIAADRLSTVSYGKERPACVADTAECHELNRRTEFRVRGH